MSYLAIGISLFVGLAFWYMERNIYNPGTLMGFLWTLICVLAKMRAYELYAASDYTYLLISIALAMFGLGCLVARNMRTKFSSGIHLHLLYKSEEATFNYTIIRILCVLSVIIMADNAIDNAKDLMSGIEMSDIRARDTATSFSHPIFYLLNNYIVRPFSFAILPMFAVDFLLSKHRDTVITLSTVIIILERVLIEGGRVIIIYALTALFITMAFSKGRIKIKKSTVFMILGITVVACVAVYIISLSRGIEDGSDMLRSLYMYVCGCVPHLSIRLEHMARLETYTFGFASMNGIVHYVLTLFENVGMDYPDFFALVRELINVEDKVYISGDLQQFNAFVSPIYYMYIDGGIAGVAIGMFLYGFFSHHLYKKTKNNLNPRNLTVYLLIAQGLLTTMVRMQFSQVYYTVAFFFICFLINKPLPKRQETLESTCEIKNKE